MSSVSSPFSLYLVRAAQVQHSAFKINAYLLTYCLGDTYALNPIAAWEEDIPASNGDAIEPSNDLKR